MSDYNAINTHEQMVQSSIALADLQASYIAIYLTMVFAYTTVAYIAGKQLSRVQVFIATFVYVAAAFYISGVIISITTNLITYSKRIQELGVTVVDRTNQTWIRGLIAGQVCRSVAAVLEATLDGVFTKGRVHDFARSDSCWPAPPAWFNV